MAGLGKRGTARRGGGQLSLLLPVSLPSDKQTQVGANGRTSPLTQESHGSKSVHTVPLPKGHVEHNVESSSTRRKWGPTQNIDLAKIKKQAGEKLNVEMPKELGRIVGLECQPLITKLGCIVWKHAPLQVTKWELFNLHDELVKDITFAQMNTQYQNHHHKLHKNYFLPHPTTEVAMQHSPPGVPQEDWNYLSSYFSSDEFKKMSAQNARNQAMQNTPNIAQTGEVLGPIELYKITHDSNKKLSWVNDRAHHNYPSRSLSKHHNKSELEAANKRANELEEKLSAQQKDMKVIKGTKKATNEILQVLMEQMQEATQNVTNEIWQALMKQMQDERHMSTLAPDSLSW
ncbi:unnamed protein product [Ilex paraguariensis]|uniref:Uncharacterized protein n=1 Tax=Ilex paraguariensis TaxID=185542 RepID=A0ABC8QQ51_9AQUA